MSETSDGAHAFLSSWSLSSFDLGDFAAPREGFVVVVADPLTNEIDCYGPYADRGQADHEALECGRSGAFSVSDGHRRVRRGSGQCGHRCLAITTALRRDRGSTPRGAGVVDH